MELTVYGAGRSHTIASPVQDWWDVQWPIATGCTKVSPGCEFCSAAEIVANADPAIARVDPDRGPRWSGTVITHPDRIERVDRWDRPVRAFVCPTSDFFHEAISDAFRDDAWAVMTAHPEHTFVIVTKRAEHAAVWLANRFVPRHVWLVVSIESQDQIERVGYLRAIDAPIRGVSCEPLLGPIELRAYLRPSEINWVIAGPELGPWARPCDPRWMESLSSQAYWCGVPFFTKHRIDGLEWRELPR